ncbi:MAG TPA: protein kinase [Thermoanaerobaculia bacterium]|nr:protein kinase [Thermoanaerobaculia bacterium]
MDQQIGNWQIERQLGEGGMGTVFLARHQTLGTLAALKVLSRSLGHDGKFRERFVREARAQAQLRHPGIAQVMDFLEQGDDLFVVIEYLSGGTLAERLDNRRERLPVATAVSWTRQALAALDYAHQHGVIHRDIKPSNLMFDEAGHPKIVDFGIALTLDGRRLTTTGALGTPHYMSPEQIRRPLDVDHRTDVYAMGVVLYEMLAGHPPFDAISDFDIRFAQVNETPKPLGDQNPEIPAQLEAIVMKALAKDPNERYSGCGEFATVLESWDRSPASARISMPPPLPPRPTPLPAATPPPVPPGLTPSPAPPVFPRPTVPPPGVPLPLPQVPVTTQYADFGMRFAALLIDIVILLVIDFAIIAVMVSLDSHNNPDGTAVSIALGAFNWLYYALFESSSLTATPGKRALGMRVTDLEGRRISFGRATGRYFGKILSGILGLGFLAMLWSPRKQCLHDQIAGCLVLRVR